MAVEIPKLHTENFQKIRNDLVNVIPNYSKEWTNQNASDPGITILELFSWMADLALYQLDHISMETHLAFLRLVSGYDIDQVCAYVGQTVAGFMSFTEKMLTEFNTALMDSLGHADKHLAELLCCQATLELKYHNNNITPEDFVFMKLSVQNYIESRYRAVTEDDYFQLVPEATDSVSSAEPPGSRVLRTIIQYEQIAGSDMLEPKIYLVSDYRDTYTILQLDSTKVYTNYHLTLNDAPQLPDLTATVKEYLKPRRLVGTPLNIAMAMYTKINIYVEVVFGSMEVTLKALEGVREKMIDFLDPVKGGDQGKGWPFKKPVTVYELSDIIESVPGVERVRFMKILPAPQPPNQDNFYSIYETIRPQDSINPPDSYDYREIPQLVKLNKLLVKASGV